MAKIVASTVPKKKTKQYGKTKRHFKSECVNILKFLLLLEKRLKGDNDSAINEHHLFWNHSSSFDGFSY